MDGGILSQIFTLKLEVPSCDFRNSYLWLSNCTVTLTQMNSFSLALKEKKEKPGVKVGAPPTKTNQKTHFQFESNKDPKYES